MELRLDYIIFLFQCNALKILAAFPAESEQDTGYRIQDTGYFIISFLINLNVVYTLVWSS